MRGHTVTITLPLRRGKVAKTIPLFQYDYGQKLIIQDVELPVAYEVNFANEMHGEAITSIGDSTGVEIPDSLLATGSPVYLWLFVHDDSTDGETEFQGVIPVIRRARTADQDPTPEERSVITQVIAALNAAAAGAEAAKDAAEAAQGHIENLSVSAESVSPESSATVTKTVSPSGEVSLAFSIPRGEKGETGDTGEQGETGSAGADGSDGFSPVVSLEKEDGVTTLSITDAVGTQTAEINDGDPTALIDDTAGEGDTEKTWSADKVNDMFNSKVDKADPVFSGALSLGRATGTSSGTNSTALGLQLEASGNFSHAEGYGNEASGTYAHVEGNDSNATGDISHAEGSSTASGILSHSEGNNARATGHSSHAEGVFSLASGPSSHVEGDHSTASGTTSHAEGYYSSANGGYSHAEGDHASANGHASHAQGRGTTANGAYSHVFGMYNKADSYDDTNWPEWVAGTYYAKGAKVKITTTEEVGPGQYVVRINGYVCKTANSDDEFTESKWTDQEGRMNYAEIVGRGTGASGFNIRELDWDGNEYITGSLTIGKGKADETTITATQLKALLALLN